MSLNVEEPYKEEEVLYQVQVRLNSRGRERVLKVKVYDCAPPLYIHSWSEPLMTKFGFHHRLGSCVSAVTKFSGPLIHISDSNFHLIHSLQNGIKAPWIFYAQTQLRFYLCCK